MSPDLSPSPSTNHSNIPTEPAEDSRSLLPHEYGSASSTPITSSHNKNALAVASFLTDADELALALRDVVRHHRLALHSGAVAALHRIAAGLKLAPPWNALRKGQRVAWKTSHVPSISRRTIERYIEEAREIWPKIQKRAACLLNIPAKEAAHILPETLLAMDRQSELELLLSEEKKKTTKNSLDAKLHWRTPEYLVTAVEKYLGQIDLDVTAELEGPFRVPAVRHLSLFENSLSPNQSWEGNIYVCPPWTDELTQWVNRTCCEFEHNRATQSVLLLPAIFDAPWARVISQYPRAFIHERLSMELPDGSLRGKLPHTAMIVALSLDSRMQHFAECFRHLADIFVSF